MPTKKKPIKKETKKRVPKTKNLSRYNIFQRELSEYIKETGKPKSEWKKYRSLYKEIDKDVPVKSFYQVINGLVLKRTEKPKKLFYSESFPFYMAVNEFILPIYSKVLLKIKFNDGVTEFTYEGDSLGFQDEYEKELKGYLRDNYSNSTNLANFVLVGGDDSFAEYRITSTGEVAEIPNEKPVASVSPKKSVVGLKDEEAVLKQREKTAKAETKRLKTELALIKELKSLGFTDKEIKKRLG